MFIVTNRALDPKARGLRQLGKYPNPRGPNELRMIEVQPRHGGWDVQIIPDVLDAKWRKAAGIDQQWLASMGFPKSSPAYGSMYVAKKLLDRVNPGRAGGRGKGRDLLVFVHGYNNDMEDVVTRAHSFERNFGVEVLAFSWPANGGGVAGAAAYLSDKNDARVSVGALDRTLAKIDDMITRFNAAYMAEIRKMAGERFGDNDEHRREMIARLMDKGCPFKVSLVAHSMGNYLYKHLLLSSASMGTKLMFDNVVLVAADANNKEHALWVDRIRARRRVFITINENDSALRVSRMKVGDQQLARLGHYPRDLDSRQGVYVDFTGAKGVNSSHAYFEGSPLRNVAVKRFFQEAFIGEFAEKRLVYDVAQNLYRVQ